MLLLMLSVNVSSSLCIYVKYEMRINPIIIGNTSVGKVFAGSWLSDFRNNKVSIRSKEFKGKFLVEKKASQKNLKLCYNPKSRIIDAVVSQVWL